jgi:hypothetical protein
MSEGSPLDAVVSRYREPMPPALVSGLQEAAAMMELAKLLPQLRELLVEQLAREAFAATESLKEYIGYSVEEGEEAGGFEEHFPEEVMLSHAVAAYELLLRF